MHHFRACHLYQPLFAGTEIKGARRWLHVFGFSLQPSEFIKPAFAVVSAWLISLQKPTWHKIGGQRPERNKHGLYTAGEGGGGYYVVIAIYGLIISLLMMQPDFGMSFVVTCMFASQIFLAGLRLRYLAAILSVGGAAVAGAYLFFPHVKSRFDRFLDPSSGDTYQVDQSLAAFRHGGLIGTGPGQGTVKMNLPDAHADFIFSVAGEEFGFIFIFIIISLFLFIILRGFNRLSKNGDMFSILAVGSLLTMFGLQALIHMGSSVNLLPAKGMTLPFISYGGSSLLSLGISMGVILALTRRHGRLV